MSIWSSVSFFSPSGYLHGFLFIFDYDVSRCVLFVIYPPWGSPSILDFHDFWQILSHYAFKQFFYLITSLFSFVEFYLSQSSWMLVVSLSLPFSPPLHFSFYWPALKFTELTFFPQLCQVYWWAPQRNSLFFYDVMALFPDFHLSVSQSFRLLLHLLMYGVHLCL